MADWKKLPDVWARYQRGDLDREEFEGSIAELAEAPSQSDPCAVCHSAPWTITLYLVPQIAASDDDQLHCLFCGKGHNVEWETGYRPEGTGKLVGCGICERCRVRLKAFVPRGVVEPSQKPSPVDAGEGGAVAAWAEYSARHGMVGVTDKWAVFGDGWDRGFAAGYAAAKAEATK